MVMPRSNGQEVIRWLSPATQTILIEYLLLISFFILFTNMSFLYSFVQWVLGPQYKLATTSKTNTLAGTLKVYFGFPWLSLSYLMGFQQYQSFLYIIRCNTLWWKFGYMLMTIKYFVCFTAAVFVIDWMNTYMIVIRQYKLRYCHF